MTDNEEEQEMEVEALGAILMDDFKEIESSTSGLCTSSRCFQITVSPMGYDEEEPTEIPVRLALVFAHTPNYPEELPLLEVKSLQGVKPTDLAELKNKLNKEASENIGMPMMYTLATSAKDWLREKYGNDEEEVRFDEEEEAKEEVIEPHGLPVTAETFVEWRDAFEAEIALEKAKLMPELIVSTKEKRMTGRQWFESGRHMQKGGTKSGFIEDEEEDEEELDFDDDFEDEDADENEILDHYLAEK